MFKMLLDENGVFCKELVLGKYNIPVDKKEAICSKKPDIGYATKSRLIFQSSRCNIWCEACNLIEEHDEYLEFSTCNNKSIVIMNDDNELIG